MAEIKYLQLLKCHPINYSHSVNRICTNVVVNNPLICTETLWAMFGFVLRNRGCANARARARAKNVDLIRRWCLLSSNVFRFVLQWPCLKPSYIIIATGRFVCVCASIHRGVRLYKHLHRPKIRYTKIYWIGYTDATLAWNAPSNESLESACITNDHRIFDFRNEIDFHRFSNVDLRFDLFLSATHWDAQRSQNSLSSRIIEIHA